MPRISELNIKYSMLLERKKNSYAECRKTKSEMQNSLVEQKTVEEILKADAQKMYLFGIDTGIDLNGTV